MPDSSETERNLLWHPFGGQGQVPPAASGAEITSWRSAHAAAAVRDGTEELSLELRRKRGARSTRAAAEAPRKSSGALSSRTVDDRPGRYARRVPDTPFALFDLEGDTMTAPAPPPRPRHPFESRIVADSSDRVAWL